MTLTFKKNKLGVYEYTDEQGKVIANKGQITINKIVAIIVGILFAVVLVDMLPSLMKTFAEGFYNWSQEMALLTTEIGTGPANFANNSAEWMGWFIVLGPFVLVLYVVIDLFLRKSTGNSASSTFRGYMSRRRRRR